jgi:SAM-dependent methyltransferase
MTTTSNHIRKWDERYARGEHDCAEPVDVIVRVVRDFPPGRALDLACGLGRNAIALARAGWSVTAVDASAIAIERLRERAAAEGLAIDAVIADLESDAFVIEPESYDLICDSFYLQRSLIPQIKAGVRPGGLVAITLPIEADINPDFLVRTGEVRSWFSNWTIIHYDEAGGVAHALACRVAILGDVRVS